MLKKLLRNKYIRGLVRLVKSIIKNDFYGMAAEMGFMLVVGIFPFMLFLMALFGWMGNKAYMGPILVALSNIMPKQAMALLKSVLEETMIFNHGTLLAVLGIIMTIVLSTNGVAVVLKGLNRAYKVEETRSFIYTRILSFLMVFVNVLVLFLTINVIIFGKVIIMFCVENFGLSKAVAITILTLRWPVSFLALYLMAFLSYYILPDLRGNDAFKRRSALPGTIFFTTFWLVGSWGFSVYVNNLSTYNMVYGTIGAFFILMVWLYYTSILLLIGGEINSQVYNRLSQRSNEIREEIAQLRLKNQELRKSKG
ncbi:MAG: YihY/virulence factor BrkB family protein [Cyanobacteria bacterium SIG26]|nr:YihY/virulence factor BrkB family protein [Cyanobacteria bacterium SIG26]